jgi:hypothetical protein
MGFMWEKGNPASKHNLLKRRVLVGPEVPGFSAHGEIPGSAMSRRACMVKQFCEGRTCVLRGLFPRCLTEYQPRDPMFSAKLWSDSC